MLPFDDAQFEARRDRLEVREPKDLVCAANNHILKMCIKPTCTAMSLFCDNKECPSCPKDEHKKCQQIFLDGIA